MNESNSSSETVNRLPAVVPQPATPAVASGKSALASICIALTPLALEVAVGLTRKWLSGIAVDSSRQDQSVHRSKQSSPTGGLQRRRRGK